MALLHKATLTPTKPELVTAWLATRPWHPGGGVTSLAAYRFDDPDGEVGLEGTLFETADGTVLHVPMTYRGSPLAGAEEHLIGTTDHSVLGPRWVYDGCGDPVFVRALATAVLTGGTEAEQFFEVDGRREARASSATVRGSGAATGSVAVPETLEVHDAGETTVVRAGAVEVVVARVVGAGIDTPHTLAGRWADRHAVLAGVRQA